MSLSPTTQSTLDDAAELFRKAKRVVVLTGAGISTPSGIPDFRSEGSGLWSRDEPLETASLSTFRTTPERFFNSFRPLASQIFHAQPDPAHLALAEFEQAGHQNIIITQNKGTFKNELEQVRGIGKSTVDLLLKKFRSVKNIREKSREELAEIIGNAKTGLIFEYFRNK